MKDLIIGCSDRYNWDQLKFWINSINKSGFEGDKVLIIFNGDSDTIKKVLEAGFQVISPGKQDEFGNLKYSGKTAVHVERFIHMYDYIRQHDNRYIVTTDVRDVIFQSNPFAELRDYIEELNYKAIFSSESIQYKNEGWGDNNLLETYGPYVHKIFREEEIFNVGVLGGTKEYIQSLCLNIFINAINRPIPICDQAVFNFLISQTPYTDTCMYARSETGWACQLGTTADPSKIEDFKPHLLEKTPVFHDGKITTSYGKPYVIVHQYDRTQWRKQIEEQYE